MSKFQRTGLAALVAGLVAAVGVSQIKALTLEEMIETADGAIHGTITHQRSFRVDHPVDGPALYFTNLTIEGRSLIDGTSLTVDVTFHGGFVSETEGVYNSEAPAADDCKPGNTVVVFYQWSDDMGGGVAANSLVAAHGGLFRSIAAPSNATVLGRGAGYAIESNIRIDDLDTAVGKLHAAKLQRRQAR